MYACDMRSRTVANIQIGFTPWANDNTKDLGDTHTGSLTHFGRVGDEGTNTTLRFDAESTTPYTNEHDHVCHTTWPYVSYHRLCA